jgi:transcriptional regulator NrdR family protein
MKCPGCHKPKKPFRHEHRLTDTGPITYRTYECKPCQRQFSTSERLVSSNSKRA